MHQNQTLIHHGPRSQHNLVSNFQSRKTTPQKEKRREKRNDMKTEDFTATKSRDQKMPLANPITFIKMQTGQIMANNQLREQTYHQGFNKQDKNSEYWLGFPVK